MCTAPRNMYTYLSTLLTCIPNLYQHYSLHEFITHFMMYMFCAFNGLEQSRNVQRNLGIPTVQALLFTFLCYEQIHRRFHNHPHHSHTHMPDCMALQYKWTHIHSKPICLCRYTKQAQYQSCGQTHPARRHTGMCQRWH